MIEWAKIPNYTSYEPLHTVITLVWNGVCASSKSCEFFLNFPVDSGGAIIDFWSIHIDTDPYCQILSKLSNFVKIVKFCQNNFFQNYHFFKFMKFFPNYHVLPKMLYFVKINIFFQNYQFYNFFQNSLISGVNLYIKYNRCIDNRRTHCKTVCNSWRSTFQYSE